MTNITFHCSRVLAEGWKRYGCPEPAVIVYEVPEGPRRGYCVFHRDEVVSEARRRGWEVWEPGLAVAA